MRRWARTLVGAVAFALFFLSAAGVGAAVAAHYYGPGLEPSRVQTDIAAFTVAAAVSYWCLSAAAGGLTRRRHGET